MQFREYTENRGARLKSNDKELILVKGSLFEVDKIDGRFVVVKDGLLYPVKKEYVKELLNRSAPVKPSKQYKTTLEFLNQNGSSILENLSKNIKKIAPDATTNFSNKTVYAEFKRIYNGKELTCIVKLTNSSIAANILCIDKKDYEGWDFIPKLDRFVDRFSKYLTDKYGLKFKNFSTLVMYFSNIHLPDGTPFSGVNRTYAANWNLK